VAGQTEVAALSLTDPDSQARALVRVAEILAGAGDTRSACRVAAAVCVAGHWTTAAGPVLLLDPNAFATLTGVLDSR